jgi:uncharacterized protein (TIGR03118 family)
VSYKHVVSSIAVLAVILAMLSSRAEASEGKREKDRNRYTQTNLVSDNNTAAPAAFNDPNLLNPWGVAFFPGGPFWVSDNGAGVSTLYDGTGVKQALTVTIPAGADSSAGAPGPSGMVWNGNPMAFTVGTPAVAALFIWATEDGTIAAWQPALGTTAQIVVPNSNFTTGPVYKGLAIGNNSSGLFLFATDFRAAKIAVWDTTFAFNAALSAKFLDDQIPAGFAPFGIQNIRGQLWVTYAKQDGPKHDPVNGEGNGFVDVFGTDGNLIRRFASQDGLNSPWGVVLAPDNFGEFSNDILIGNFGDGKITAWELESGKFVDFMKDKYGETINLGTLWTLVFGGGLKASPQVLYFTTGLINEQDGLFGTLTPVPN